MGKVQRALLSVTDKAGIVGFGKSLEELGVEILSTGGTAKKLREGGVAVKDVSEFTGFPECFDGRVKTLHPLVHGGILYQRDNPEHVKRAEELGVKPIDLVAVNLYDFESASKKPGISLDALVEEVDIGGPSMLMAAFKNHKDVAVVADPQAYDGIIRELRETGEISADTKRVLAAYAVNRVADYRAANAMVLTEMLTGEKTLRLAGRQGKQLGRYGENWHQKAWIFTLPGVKEPNVVTAEQLHGTALGYNNYLDADAALSAVMEFDEPCTVIIKHNTPCGIATSGMATADRMDVALERAWQGDIVSAFGSVIAFNREVDLETIKVLSERPNPDGKKGWMIEVLVAPSYTPEVLAYIKDKKSKENLRILAVGDMSRPQEAYDFRFVRAGILRQERDKTLYIAGSIDACFEHKHTVKCENSGADRVVGVVTATAPYESMKALYDFAWKAVKPVKSNAIVIAREYAPGKFQVLGTGPGQPNRVNSCKLAIDRAEAALALEYHVLKGEGTPAENAFFQGQSEMLNEMRKCMKPDVTYQQYKSLVLRQSVVGSDAFFPFEDGPTALAEFGLRNFIQPGGSARDVKVIEVLDKYHASMVFTGTRHFRH